ncbi:hypothetical protein [Pandoraea sp. NPDC090278]|uniref:hypothetical protein n=1 Tax=Pandoraea sp. NPDC090278 TaxID=3364391 RepID=UPI00383B6BA4
MPVALQVQDSSLLKLVPEDIVNEHMRGILKTPVDALPEEKRRGYVTRTRLLNALVMVDPSQIGDTDRYLLDIRCFIDGKYREARIKQIAEEIGSSPSCKRTHLLELLTVHLWWRGEPNAMLCRTGARGGKGKVRDTLPAMKPGPLSPSEKRAKAATEAGGGVWSRTAQRSTATDDDDVLAALKTHWACGQKISLTSTYIEYKRESRNRGAKSLSWWYFYRTADVLIRLHKLDAKRNGNRIMAQYGTVRPGNSSDVTWGSLMISDMDAWTPKVGSIWGWVAGTYEPLPGLVVLFSVCRLSGAITGYEIELKSEKASSYRFCALSSLSDKSARALELGITEHLDALVHGWADVYLVDHGPGNAADAREPFVEKRIAGALFTPAPARGDFKPNVESINNCFMKIMAETVEGAFTRKSDPLSREIRKKAKNAPGIDFDDFEKCILETIIYLNRTRDCSHLRDDVMRRNGVTIRPHSIFNYLQTERRRGDAALKLSEKELLDAIIPWIPRRCRSGTVSFANATFTSKELMEYSNSLPARERKTFPVEAKRIGPQGGTILCKLRDGAILELRLTDECARQYGNASWKGMEYVQHDINASNEEDEDIQVDLKPRPPRKEKKKKSSTLTENQNDILRDAEAGRGNPELSKQHPRRSKPGAASTAHNDIAGRQRAAHKPRTPEEPFNGGNGNIDSEEEDDDPVILAARQAEQQSRERMKETSNS